MNWTKNADGSLTSGDFLIVKSSGRYILSCMGERITRDTLSKCQRMAEEMNVAPAQTQAVECSKCDPTPDTVGMCQKPQDCMGERAGDQKPAGFVIPELMETGIASNQRMEIVRPEASEEVNPTHQQTDTTGGTSATSTEPSNVRQMMSGGVSGGIEVVEERLPIATPVGVQEKPRRGTPTFHDVPKQEATMLEWFQTMTERYGWHPRLLAESPAILADAGVNPSEINESILSEAVKRCWESALKWRDVHNAEVQEMDPSNRTGWVDLDFVQWHTFSAPKKKQKAEEVPVPQQVIEAAKRKQEPAPAKTHPPLDDNKGSDTTEVDQSEERETMEISKSAAAEVFAALGMPTLTKDKPTERLQMKLRNLPKLYKIDGDKILETEHDSEIPEIKEESTRTLVLEVLKALTEDAKNVSIVEEGAPKKGKGKKQESNGEAQTETPKKGKKEKPEKAPKAEKNGETAPKKPAVRKKTEEGPSNKEIVYKIWKKSPTKADPEKCFAEVQERVKLSTIKGWMNAWKNGKNLPGCAGGRKAEKAAE